MYPSIPLRLNVNEIEEVSFTSAVLVIVGAINDDYVSLPTVKYVALAFKTILGLTKLVFAKIVVRKLAAESELELPKYVSVDSNKLGNITQYSF